MTKNLKGAGVALGALLVIVMSVMVALAIFYLFFYQSDFLENAANYLANLFTINLP
jgi:hypothetical protein